MRKYTDKNGNVWDVEVWASVADNAASFGSLVRNLAADLNTAHTTADKAIATAVEALGIIDRLQNNAAEDLAEIGQLRQLNARQALYCQRLIDRINALELVS